MAGKDDREYFDSLAQTVIDGYVDRCLELVRQGLREGRDPLDILEKGLAKGIKQVGDDFGAGNIFLPELVCGADVMKQGLSLLDEKIRAQGKERKSLGRIVIGTVKGDIHDIGKSVVAGVLQANGFDVIDMGVEVDAETFVAAFKEHKADCIAMSSLLTLTIREMGSVIDMLKGAGLRGQAKVMVGGAPITQEFADEIGADAYGRDAMEAVTKAKALLA